MRSPAVWAEPVTSNTAENARPARLNQILHDRPCRRIQLPDEVLKRSNPSLSLKCDLSARPMRTAVRKRYLVSVHLSPFCPTELRTNQRKHHLISNVERQWIFPSPPHPSAAASVTIPRRSTRAPIATWRKSFQTAPKNRSRTAEISSKRIWLVCENWIFRA